MIKHPNVRRTVLFSRVCFVLAALACSNLDNIIVKKSGSTTLPAGSPVSILDELGFVELGSIDVTDDQTFKSKGYSLNDIDSIKLDSLSMQITAPTSGQDFTFINKVSFYASAPGKTRVLIASGGPFAANTNPVGLDVEDVDLKPYAEAGAFSIGTEVDGHDPQNTTTIKATVGLNIDVNVLGVVCGK